MTTNTKTLLTVKTDKELKKRAERVAAAMGIPLGTMVNSFLRETVRTGKFEVTTELRPSKMLIRAIRESQREYASGKLKTFSSVDELFADLNS